MAPGWLQEARGFLGRKRRYLQVLLSVCVLCVQQAVHADDLASCSLGMMTYNIKAARHMYPAAQGLEMIAQAIEAAGKPDVLMLQEVMRFDPYVDHIDEFEWLRHRLGYPQAFFASGAADPVAPGTAEWGVAIYLRTGSVAGVQKYRLGWNRVLLRVSASMQGTLVHFFNTHTGSGAIAEQVVTIAGIIDGYTALQQPVILGGDFNAVAGDPAMAPLRNHLEDVFIVLSLPVSSIDTFYVSPVVTAHAAQVAYDPTRASDHDPVTCVLSPWPPIVGPTIAQQPHSQDRCPGDTVVFTVSASGNGPLSYQWQKDQANQQQVNLADGGSVSGATTPTLTLSGVGGSDVARYRCVVTDSRCSRASREATLTLTPTAILNHPSAQTIGPGGTAVFSVAARGAGTLSYQWQTNGTDLLDDGRIIGAQTPGLQISDCRVTDQADYRCRVSGYCGVQTSTAATLAVAPAPPISFYEDWDEYAEGAHDPVYLERWLSIPGVNRYDIWVGNYDEYSPPNSVRVRVLQPMGITRPLAGELTALVPGADQVLGTDPDALSLLVKLYLQYGSEYVNADVFAELSRGDVRAPPGSSPTVLPVLAFGLTAGTHGGAGYPRFFDGRHWHHVTAISTAGGHNDLRMTVRKDSVQLQGLRAATGLVTLGRLYTGGFDRISLRTVNNTGRVRSISDVSLTGGTVIAPLSISAGPDKHIPAGGAATLEATVSGGLPPYTIEWSPVEGLDSLQLLRPTAAPTITTVYALTVTDSAGRSETHPVQVIVLPPPLRCDFDFDTDVDQSDFGLLQRCLGEPNPAQHPTCWLMDLDANDSIDADDVALFINCVTGPAFPTAG